LVLLGTTAPAQQNGRPNEPAAPQLSPGHALPAPSVTATRAIGPIVIDGKFDEKSWELAPVISNLVQRDPVEGAEPTERTEIRVLYDSQQIYFAVICYDSDPSGIVATELRRDDDMETDDIFEIMLDTFHDHRNGYRFRVNPLGTRQDQFVGNEGESRNNNWDEQWDASARITPEGWVAEIAIPFKAVRFAGDNGATWGLNFHRTIMRKNEEIFWAGYTRGYTFTKISGSGHLEGLSGIEGFRYRIKPYISGTALRSPAPGGGAATGYRGQIGLEDAKYLLTPDLALDLTINPDFAQADVDQAQVNLTRFSLFFPEKREFFQEGSGIFAFGGGFTGNDLVLFHSRRIGLSEARQEIPILGGLKLSGTQGPLEIGLLNMQTDRSTNSLGQESPGQNFSVVRLRSKILARSSVGFLMTRNTGSPLGGSNQGWGADSSFTFHRYLGIFAYLAKTASRGLEDRDWAARGKISWNSDRTELTAQHLFIGENFRPEMGFVARAEPGWTGLQRTQATVAFRPRPNLPVIREVQFTGSADYIADQDGALDTRIGQAGLGFEFHNGDLWTLEFSNHFERLREPFRISGEGGTVPAGDYNWNFFSTRFTAYRGRRISGNFDFERGGFYDGTITTFAMAPYVKPNARWSFTPGLEWNRIERRNATFTTRELNAEVNYAINPNWLTRTSFLLNSQNKSLTLNARLNYIYHSSDDLFFVYSETRNYGDRGGLVNRSFIVKLTYSIDR
ncbi:MAG TPA: DUF5916 domain-containing protein, partial [Terriglobia bacterium]|nr:DUF5916 domain-containing protein [Terriglobia bacterium]